MQAHPALVLNADFRPLSYFPLSTLPWQDAITAVVKDHGPRGLNPNGEGAAF